MKNNSIVKFKRYPSEMNSSSKVLLGGALAGCLIGVSAAFLMAPSKKKQKSFNFHDNAEEITNEVMRTGKKVLNGVHGIADGLKHTTDYMYQNAKTVSGRNLMLGALGGSVLGVVGTIMGANISSKHVGRIIQKIKGTSRPDHIQEMDWPYIAKNLLGGISSFMTKETEENSDEEQEEDNSHANNIKMQEVMKWVMIGVNFWDSIKNRR